MKNNKIIRKRDENGEIFYMMEDGRPIDFCEDTLGNIFACGMERFEELSNILIASENGGPGLILRDVKDQLNLRFQRAYDFIEENYGEITIDLATYGQPGIEPETLLGVNFKPASNKEVCHDVE